MFRTPLRNVQSADFSGTRKQQADYFHGNLQRQARPHCNRAEALLGSNSFVLAPPASGLTAWESCRISVKDG
jgi:hypothetical protein